MQRGRSFSLFDSLLWQCKRNQSAEGIPAPRGERNAQHTTAVTSAVLQYRQPEDITMIRVAIIGTGDVAAAHIKACLPS